MHLSATSWLWRNSGHECINAEAKWTQGICVLWFQSRSVLANINILYYTALSCLWQCSVPSSWLCTVLHSYTLNLLQRIVEADFLCKCTRARACAVATGPHQNRSLLWVSGGCLSQSSILVTKIKLKLSLLCVRRPDEQWGTNLITCITT